jgi:hypothetical protein
MRDLVFHVVTAAFLLVSVGAQGPVLSELMARNANTFADTDGEYKDWFEVWNKSSSSINLGGYYVTDDPADLTKWRIPSTTIAAGAYLVIFASRKNRAVSGRELHTNFTCDGDGEYLALVRSDGRTIASSFFFPAQRTGYSYGLSGSSMLFFPSPTPRAANNSGLPSFVGATTILGKRGFYTASVNVSITCATAGANIRYTLNGSKPTSTTGFAYTGPIKVSTTTILRAAGFKSGLGPSPTDSRTFLFVDDVIRQPDRPSGYPRYWGSRTGDYGMDPEIVLASAYKQTVKQGLQSVPMISVTIPIADLFGTRGLYLNTRSTGPKWEREVSAEFYDPVTGAEFQLNAGLRVQGGASRNPNSSPKHSLSLRFRDSYNGDLKFELFPGSRVARFDSVHLRAMYNNSWIHWSSSQRRRGTMIRDQWMRDSLIDMGQHDAGEGRFVCLFLNGMFWGVYNLQERAEAAHYAAWHGGDSIDYDARNGSEFVDGTTTAWNAMRNAVIAGNWPTIRKTLALDNYIDFLIINRFGGNSDLKTSGNWRAAGGGPGAAPWRFYSWDGERVLESVNRNGVSPTPDPPGLVNYLARNADFVVRFGDRIHRHFFNSGALTSKQTAARFSRRIVELDTAIVAESARWGDYRRDVHSYSNGPYELYTRNSHWLPETSRLTTTYFPKRTAIVLGQYRSLSLYPSTSAPIFSQHGGMVKSGFQLTISGTGGQIYYTSNGVDPRASGGGISTSAVRYAAAVKLLVSTTVKARILNGTKWSALTDARFLIESISINELLAKNTTGIVDNFGEREDWIELYNDNTQPVVIGGMYLTDSIRDPMRWRIPSGYVLQPGKTLLIWADDQPTQGQLHATFKLSVAGEEVLLFDIDGKTLLDRVAFGQQQADISTGRLHDGRPRLVTFPSPSPNKANSIGVCGARRYSTLDPTTQPLDLQMSGTPAIGKQVTMQVRGGPAIGVRALIAGILPGEIPFPISSSRILIGFQLWLMGAANAGTGGAADIALPIPNAPVLVGESAYFQAWAINAGPWLGSVGLEIKFCR